jgi:hypothetical protein
MELERKGRIVEWAKGTVWLHDGILFIDSPPNRHVTIKDAREITRIFLALAPDGAPLLVNLDNGNSQDRDIRLVFRPFP